MSFLSREIQRAGFVGCHLKVSPIFTQGVPGLPFSKTVHGVFFVPFFLSLVPLSFDEGASLTALFQCFSPNMGPNSFVCVLYGLFFNGNC